MAQKKTRERARAAGLKPVWREEERALYYDGKLLRCSLAGTCRISS